MISRRRFLLGAGVALGVAAGIIPAPVEGQQYVVEVDLRRAVEEYSAAQRRRRAETLAALRDLRLRAESSRQEAALVPRETSAERRDRAGLTWPWGATAERRRRGGGELPWAGSAS